MASRILSARFTRSCASPINLSEKQKEIAGIVKQKLIDGDFKLEPSFCVCGSSPNDVLISEVDRYGLPLNSVLCRQCGTIRFDPYLSDQSLSEFYTHYYQQLYGRVVDLESYFQRQYSYGRKFLSAVSFRLKKGDTVIEVGCGAGGGLRAFQENGYEVVGCDYSKELIEAGKRKGIAQLYYGNLFDLRGLLPNLKAKVIYLNHVFEHLVDPYQFLLEAKSLLLPEGFIAIAVPDVSRIHCFEYPNSDLLLMIHIAHKYNFSLEGLRRLSMRAGYSLSPLFPDQKIKTPTSSSPELWAQFQPESHDTCLRDCRFPVGEDMLRYLRRVELVFTVRKHWKFVKSLAKSLANFPIK